NKEDFIIISQYYCPDSYSRPFSHREYLLKSYRLTFYLFIKLRLRCCESWGSGSVVSSVVMR
ncbi:MAG: hypothetical protein QW104_05850, partial [Nitrososphaerota archaeon]